MMMLPSAAVADDGDYCVGQNYMTYWRSAQHKRGALLARPSYLYILRLGHGEPITPSGLQIEPLSEKAISCGAESVVVTGWNRLEETSYEIRWDKQGRPFKAREGSIPRADTSTGLPASSPSNLARLSERVERAAYSHSTRWTESERVPLLIDPQEYRYVLESSTTFPSSIITPRPKSPAES
jgi:hypothetical protein